MHLKLKGSVQEPHMCIYAVLAPLTIFALSISNLTFWHLKILFVYFFKYADLSKTAFLYLGVFKFSFCKSQIPLKSSYAIYFTAFLTLIFAQVPHISICTVLNALNVSYYARIIEGLIV